MNTTKTNLNSSAVLNYVIELRARLLRCLFAVALVIIVLLPFSNALYSSLAKPLLLQMPAHHTLIATAITASFFIPLKFTILLSLVLIIPFLLYQLWAYLAPALYKNERQWVWIFLILSTVLFYTGMLFAYFVVFPLLFKFFIQTAPAGVTVLPDISQYLDLVSQLFFAFGLAFEVPVIILALVVTGITTVAKISAMRRYFIVVAFVVAMLLTPPDVVSQSLLAIPLCLLFELGLLSARLIAPKKSVILANPR